MCKLNFSHLSLDKNVQESILVVEMNSANSFCSMHLIEKLVIINITLNTVNGVVQNFECLKRL